MAEAIHTMRMVSKRTGLSPHVIRVWERRYGAVNPARTSTNRRVYHEADVERLKLLHQATQIGHSIGQAVTLSNERLKELVNDAPPPPAVGAGDRNSNLGPSTHVARCLAAVKSMDAQALNQELESAVLELGTQGLLTQVAARLGQQVGDLWRAGEITAAHEHFLSASLRNFLGRHSQQFSASAPAPAIIIATPSGQIHELGAVLVAAAANNLGWRAIYLGTSLPAAEIAGAAREQRVRAVALSIVYPEDDPALPGQLRQLKQYLPENIELIVGGRGAPAYAATLVEIGARVANKLEDLFPTLEGLRKTAGRR
ncbi:MAG: MerR family transcriptional regulator [Verrucomicrobia bacterium]|nr:MerR family transcriptional regulator [Verrucomicrobiota bacterium]